MFMDMKISLGKFNTLYFSYYKAGLLEPSIPTKITEGDRGQGCTQGCLSISSSDGVKQTYAKKQVDI